MKRAMDFPKIHLCTLPTDMRKQSQGLAEIAQYELEQDPFSDQLFIFCNRRRDIIKALYFDRAGFCLWTKKLDQGKFPWPKDRDSSSIEISSTDIELVFDGVDVFKRHKKLDFESVS